ncbi:hypothetical protein BASA62_000771 [Batrachochytrium salamandrivorans]|nr:hypothetical protein BASA62_000771 [Batrachochytrium salamandrivorans]
MTSTTSSPQMTYRFLGNSGLKVSVLSLGGWVTQGSQVGNEIAFECMKTAYDAGINFFDTAEVYAAGESEKVMGEAIKKYGWSRSSLVISTKIYWGGEGPNDKGLSRKHIIEGTNASLARLQLEYVDLIYAHRPDELTPMEEIVRAFNFVIEQGKAFYWGTSEWSAEQLTDAYRVAERLNLIPPLMEQPQYNMFHRDRVEVEYAPLYKKHGLGTTIWSPLASGVLTGKYLDGVPEDSRLALQNNFIMVKLRKELQTEQGLAKHDKVKKLKVLAESHGVTLAQLALAWCIKNPNVSSVITGASRVSQVLENLKALEIVSKLTPEVMAEIEKILENTPTHPIARLVVPSAYFLLHPLYLILSKSSKLDQEMGLQNEKTIVPTHIKVDLIRKLVESGLIAVEATSFVSPKWVPQMADASEVYKQITQGSTKINCSNVAFPVLVPNLKGLQTALDLNVKEIAIFGAASESFSQKNINCSVEESIVRFKDVVDSALAKGVRVRGYVSTIVGCPYEGDISPKAVADLAKRMFDMGCYEISLGDTIGDCYPT